MISICVSRCSGYENQKLFVADQILNTCSAQRYHVWVLQYILPSWHKCAIIFCATISSWWRHQMETFSALVAFCAGNSPVPGEFSAQRPVTRSFNVFFDLNLNKQLSKQSWGWWFETPSGSLWRQCNVIQCMDSYDYLIWWCWIRHHNTKHPNPLRYLDKRSLISVQSQGGY